MSKINFIITILLIFFATGNVILSQVPYVPTPYEVVEAMLQLAEVKENDIVYDLGCGDGRIVVTAAKKYGARGVGVDNNETRIEESNANAKENDVTDKTKFLNQNLFETDLSEASVVTLYLLSEINVRLRPKLFKELKPGTRIVSHSFDMDDWEPDTEKHINNRTIYFWKIPANFSGTWEWDESGTTHKLNLTQEFQQVTGDYQIGNKTNKINASKASGNKVELSYNTYDSQNKIILELPKKENGNMINGSIVEAGSNHGFTARRDPNTIVPLDPALIEESESLKD